MGYAKTVIQHLAAFLVALALLVIVDQACLKIFAMQSSPHVFDLPKSLYIPNLTDPTGRSEKILEAFLKENKLVVIGSSELTGVYPEMPYRWVPAQTGLPALGLGSAGFQCLPVLFVLYKYQELLNADSKIMIVISPQWLRDGDSSVAAFLQYARHGDFDKLNANDPAARTIRDFILRKRHDFGAMPLEVQLFVTSPESWTFSLLKFAHDLNRGYLNLLREKSYFYNRLVASHSVQVTASEEWKDSKFVRPQLDWKAQETKMVMDHAKMSSGNKFGFYDFTYQKLRHLPPTSLRRPEPNNFEYQALEALVQFLAMKNVKAVFVQHPLNALAYDNLQVYDEQAAQIRVLMSRYQMPFLDFTNQPYRPAWLSDFAHFSGLGWLDVDRYLVERFAQ